MKNIKDIDNQVKEITMTKKERAIELRDKIISQLPIVTSSIIKSAFDQLRAPKEYTMSSIFNAIANSIGLKIRLDAGGYMNYPNIYTVIVGSRGDTKSEAIKVAFKPIQNKDKKLYDEFLKKEESNKPSSDGNKLEFFRERIMLKKSTIEAAVETHYHNPISNGLRFDEISGFINNLGNTNSRDGEEWRDYLNDGYTNDFGERTTKGSGSKRIELTCPLLIGSIQNQMLPKAFSNGNLVSGFIDRVNFTVLLEENHIVTSEGIPIEETYNYSEFINKLLALRDFEGTTDLYLTSESKELLLNYTQKLVFRKVSERLNVKEYISKVIILVHKLIIIVHSMKSVAQKGGISNKVDVEAVELAIDINEFYLLNFEMILELAPNQSRKEVNVNDVIVYAKKNGLKQKDVVEFTKKDKGNISKMWKKAN